MNRRTTWVGIALAAIAAASALPGPGEPKPAASLAAASAPLAVGYASGPRTAELDRAAVRRLAAVPWLGGTYTVSNGEHVTVYVSRAYGDEALARRWADFFASLVHGPELATVVVYVAPLDEVEELCGSDRVLGCYDTRRLVFVGDASSGVAPSSVAAHEYGHHVADNRLNPPWRAIDWGPKRWATAANVCSRVKAGTAAPGDEGSSYALNPGEAFAESYRVLIETGGHAVGFDWPIVDPSFIPNATALAAAKDDVLRPWAPASPRVVRAKFPAGSRTWTTSVATPLDGTLRVMLTSAGANELTLLAPDRRTVLARGSWNSSGAIAAEQVICGSRSFVIRVTRRDSASRFSLRVSVP